MNHAAQVFYLQRLNRKRQTLENDIERLDRLMARPGIDRDTHNRLKLERDYVAIRLGKVKRGLLY